jgi:uncharacterized SAM-binding protein YcdF (DUF218 family)
MFFILSKTLNYLIQPLVVVSLCLLISVVVRNHVWKKRLFITGLALLFFFANDFVANEVMRAWEPPATPYSEMTRDYDWGVLLTGITISGRKLDDRVYFNRGAERVTHCVQLYKLGKIKKILVTGGSGRLLSDDEKEADDVKNALLLMGVKEEDILVEATSRNTHESAVEVKRILAERGEVPSNCILITSGYHMRRSIACFRKVGLDMDTFTTDFYAHPRSFTPDVLFIPKIDAIIVWHKLIREWAGFIAYKLVGYV